MVLEKIESQKDVKGLSVEEMDILAGEMRELIIKKVNEISGHMGPNLGFVEPTIALHYVFNSPQDKIIFDVSHQCYSHKILTGRKDGYLDAENYFISKYFKKYAPNTNFICNSSYVVEEISNPDNVELNIVLLMSRYSKTYYDKFYRIVKGEI